MTVKLLDRTTDATGVALASVSLASLAWFTLALLALHPLRPDYHPRNHMISDYAVGPHGWIMTTAFLALGAACAALALGLFRSGPRSVAARAGAGLLCVTSVGLVVTAIFPTDIPGAPFTRSGDIHDMSFRVNVASLMLAVAVLSAGLGRDARWHGYRRPAVTAALLAFVAVVIQFNTLHRGAPYGYANRFFVATLVTWLATTAWHLRRAARQ